VRSILLIEDDDELREALSSGLRELGYSVVVASDGEEGLKVLKSGPFDLVVSDLVMPNMDGTEAIKKMRQKHPNMGIVAISGGPTLNSPLYLRVAKAMGADRTLIKPFTLKGLAAAIEETLSSRAGDVPPAGPPQA